MVGHDRRLQDVLSIGKVGGGQGDPRYYIDTVAQGKDDYYTGRGEARGVWIGSGADDRGLSGEVGDEQFLDLLTQPGSATKTLLAFDLTFSAPKSVSLVYGIGDRTVSSMAREAHDLAVVEALGYMERNACWTRRGAGGKHLLQGDGLTVAAFRHRTSRAGDLQLHTHAVVANTTTATGRETTLDGRALYAHARTAGFLYQAALRKNLTETLGVAWEPVQNGVAEISGIDDRVLQHFSRRSQEIHEHLAKHGGRSARAAEIAPLETRRSKDYNVPVERLREEWRSRASEMELDRDALDAILDRRAPGPPVQPSLADSAADLRAPDGVTEHLSSFDRREVLRAWAEAHREGAAIARLETITDRWLASPHAVQLEPGGRRRHLGGPRFSTPEVLVLEEDLVRDARERQAAGVATIDPGDAERHLDEHRHAMAPEQAQLVRSLTTSGDGVQVVRAAAGTGKTRALATARELWEQNGIRVYGCALAARAALELETIAGIDSTTIARLQLDIDHSHGLPQNAVLVVDEAGMVGSRALDALARHAKDTNSKLVLVGDDRQLPEIEAGGAFRRLATDLGSVELHQVWRQREEWDRDALAELRDGDVAAWTEAYRDHGRLVARPTSDDLRATLVDDWWEAARRDGDAVMIAHRRTDVADLNHLARERMRRDGFVRGDEVHARDRSFAVGDRVIARRNDRRADVVNGLRGEVAEVDVENRTITLRVADGTTRQLAGQYLDDGRLDHAYALTAHAAQGATVDRAFVLGSDELYREWGYTAMSRHTEQARFYVVSPGSVEQALPSLEAHDQLAEDITDMLETTGRKYLAHEVLEQQAPERTTQALREAREEIERSQERIAALENERAALGRLQRSRRVEIDRSITAQEAAIERWSEHTAELLAGPSERPDPVAAAPLLPPDLSEIRTALLDPDAAVRDIAGAPPSAFPERDAWMRKAVDLVAEAPDRSTAAPIPDMDGGLDLDI